MKRSSHMFNNKMSFEQNCPNQGRDNQNVNIMKQRPTQFQIHVAIKDRNQQERLAVKSQMPLRYHEGMVREQILTSTQQQSANGVNSQYFFDISTTKYHVNSQLQNKQNINNLNIGLAILSCKSSYGQSSFQSADEDQIIQYFGHNYIQIDMTYQASIQDKENQNVYLKDADEDDISYDIDRHLCFVNNCSCQHHYDKKFINDRCIRCSTIEQVTEPTSSFHTFLKTQRPKHKQQNENKQFMIYKVNNTDSIAHNTRAKTREYWN